MTVLTREEKIKIFSKLPPQLQEMLFSDATADTIDKIGKKYGLNDDQISLLTRIIGDIILGIIPITLLAQEINSKITSDAQVAMNLAQELNIELLAPVMVSMPSAPTPATPAAPTPAPATPKTTSPTPPYQGGEKGEVASPTPRIDGYREPTFSMPEIVDLRKMPSSISTPVAPKPIPSIPTPTPTAPSKPITPPTPIIPTPPAPKPLEPVKLAPQPPLIEAEPHKILAPTPKPIDTYRESTETQGPPLVSTPIPISTPPASEPRPQYIMRPSGAPPTNLPDNVLDLRKDHGEF